MAGAATACSFRVEHCATGTDEIRANGERSRNKIGDYPLKKNGDKQQHRASPRNPNFKVVQ
jgi:hypothetical protein